MLSVFGRGLFFFVLIHSVFFAETLDATGGIDQFLTPCKERVAIGTDFHSDLFDRRSCFDDVTAGACDSRVEILRMYFRFHFITSSSINFICNLAIKYNQYTPKRKLIQEHNISK